MLNNSHIFQEYEKDRKIAQSKIVKYKDTIYKKCPRFKEIEDEIEAIGIELCKLVLKQNVSQVTKLKQKIDDLKEELDTIYYLEKIPKDFEKRFYKCKLCGDTGFVNGATCKCFIQKKMDNISKFTGLTEKINYENFQNLSFDFYSKTKQSGEADSPYDNMKNIVDDIKTGISTIDNVPMNLLFYGPPGLGKTFLCNSIANEMLKINKTILYMDAFSLLNDIVSEQFSQKSGEDSIDSAFISNVLRVDLLIIDDLGTEFQTYITQSALFNIINKRLISNKSTIISTNMNLQELKSTYSERLISRLNGEYSIFKFYGEDIRMKKKYNL